VKDKHTIIIQALF